MLTYTLSLRSAVYTARRLTVQFLCSIRLLCAWSTTGLTPSAPTEQVDFQTELFAGKGLQTFRNTNTWPLPRGKKGEKKIKRKPRRKIDKRICAS